MSPQKFEQGLAEEHVLTSIVKVRLGHIVLLELNFSLGREWSKEQTWAAEVETNGTARVQLHLIGPKVEKTCTTTQW
jgi:hypothetical protein